MTINLREKRHQGFTPPPPRGGGGAFPYLYAYSVCAARETPIFSTKFSLRSISFSQMKTISLRSIIILHFCRSGDHYSRNFKPFVAAHGRLTAASPFGQRSGGSGRPDASYTFSSGDPLHARARSGTPQFSLCRGTFDGLKLWPAKFWGVSPPFQTQERLILAGSWP